jgi:hypothetical protein
VTSAESATAQTALTTAGPVPAAATEELVLANHILNDRGVLDAYGHVSIRHPANPNRYLMARAIAPGLVTAEDIMEFDLDSNPVDRRGRSLFVERFIHGEVAGGMQDILARLMGQWLSERLGQPFVAENRTGGGGNIAAEAVVRAPADGYTLLTVGPSNAANATLYDKLSFNFIRDIAPVASLTRVPNVLEVHPSVQAKTVPELIAYAKADPGKLNFASGGNGSSQHLSSSSAQSRSKRSGRGDNLRERSRARGTRVTDLAARRTGLSSRALLGSSLLAIF